MTHNQRRAINGILRVRLLAIECPPVAPLCRLAERYYLAALALETKRCS